MRTFMRVLWILCLWLWLPAQLDAGPWPREKGSGFLSFSLELWESDLPDLPHYYGSTFFEYGLSDRLTLGSKYAMGSEAGTLFDLRLGVSLVQNRPYALSLELAVGERNTDRFLLVPELEPSETVSAPFSQVGLAYGRGFTLGDRNGWVSTELSVITPLGHETPELGLGGTLWQWDTTVGLTLDNRWKLMAQVFALQADDGTSVIKLAPGMAIPLSAHVHIELGARILTNDLEGSALALGLWQDF